MQLLFFAKRNNNNMDRFDEKHQRYLWKYTLGLCSFIMYSVLTWLYLSISRAYDDDTFFWASMMFAILAVFSISDAVRYGYDMRDLIRTSEHVVKSEKDVPVWMVSRDGPPPEMLHV